MPQLSITPVVSSQLGAGIGQVLVSAIEGADALGGGAGLDFGEVLARQLKGKAALLEKKEEAGLSLATVKEGVESVANEGGAALPVDFAALSASAFVPALPVQAGAGDGISVEADVESSLTYRNGGGVATERSRIPDEVGVELSLMYRNGSEVAAERSRVAAEADVKNPLMYRNGSEMAAERSRVAAEADVKNPLMYGNGSEVAAERSRVSAEADIKNPLMYGNGSEMAVERSRVAAKADVGNPLMYGNGSEMAVERSRVAAKADVGNPLMYGNGSEMAAERSRVAAEADVKNPLMQLSRTGEASFAAEIAANGRNLPQAVSAEQSFADKSAILVKATADHVEGEIRSVDLSTSLNPSSTAVAIRNSEPLPALPVVPRVGSAEWSGAVGEKVVWMANQSHQRAELHLNPPNLGPLEVRLTISNEQVSALFVSHHSAVREAIETALPRLREMLADNGIMLGNVTVGSESFSQQQASEQRNAKGGGRSGLVAENATARIATPVLSAELARDGMVDIFA